MQQSQGIVPAGSRIIIYAGLVILAAFWMRFDAARIGPGESLFDESSWTEWTQTALLGTTLALALYSSVFMSALQSTAILLVGLSAASLIREQDYLLDHVHPLAWESLVVLVTLPVLLLSWQRRERLTAELRVYTGTYAFGILVAALITTYVFSRLFGTGAFWREVMGEAYVPIVKTVVQEGLELYGYLLFAVATIEFVFLARCLSPDPS
jgi:hypothetical protein